MQKGAQYVRLFELLKKHQLKIGFLISGSGKNFSEYSWESKYDKIN